MLLVVLYAVWLLVPLMVLGASYSQDGGIDGPCSTAADWTGPLAEGSTIGANAEWLPPGVHCVVEGPGGYHRERVFPGIGAWIAVVLLALAPVALWPAIKRLAASAQFNRAPTA